MRQELMTSVLEAATGVHESVARRGRRGARHPRAPARRRSEARGADRVRGNASVLALGAPGDHRLAALPGSRREAAVGRRARCDLRAARPRRHASGRHAVQVATGMRNWLPELLALSANSPYWQGNDTGLASTRSQVFDVMPRSGLPPRLELLRRVRAARRARRQSRLLRGLHVRVVGRASSSRSSARSSCACATRRPVSRTSPRSRRSRRASPPR